MAENICIALTCDDGFAHYCAETIVSILANSHADNASFTFYVIGDLSSETQEKISKISSIKPCAIEFMPINATDGHSVLSKAINYRVRLPSLLPHLDKVIYSDCDVTFVGDIVDLWHEDVSGFYLGMCSNSVKKSQHENIKNEFIKSGIDPTDFNFDQHETYFNSGLLLMNLKQMREDNIEEKLLQFMTKYSSLPLLDQDALNLVCYPKIKELGLKWNFLLSYFKLRSNQVLDKYRSELSELKKHPKLIKMIHFIGKNKPDKLYVCYWPHIITPVNMYKRLFNRYLNQSGFMENEKYQTIRWRIV